MSNSMRKKSIRTEELLEISLNVFARYGYGKTTLDDIASEVSMTKANLYNYVRSKQDLYHRSVCYALEKWRYVVARKMQHCSKPAERLHVMIRESMVYIEENQQLQQLLMYDKRIFSISSDTDQFSEVNSAARDLLCGTIKEGIHSGVFYPVNPELVTEYLFSNYMMFLMKRYVIREGERTSQVFDESLKIIIRGLVKPEYLRDIQGEED